jgi:hypothetical protein
MISGATESSFRYLNLKTDRRIHFDPAQQPEILWAHHSYDQPIYQTPHLYAIPHIVCVSDWQREQFVRYLRIPPHRMRVIRNGGADVFSYSGAPKSKTLIYTSTPFRGLEYVPQIWKRVIEKHPDAHLKIFSSMRLYGLTDGPEYSKLYKELDSLPNATHYYPVAHEELSHHLADACIFFYPNTWEETSCVSLIEAMRSGCIPITSDIGALPETSLGLGVSVPMTGHTTSRGWIPDDAFIERFADRTVELLNCFDSDLLNYQAVSAQACAHYDWTAIRNTWYEYLEEITMTERQNEIQPVTFTEAISDTYLDKTRDVVMRWVDRDRELCQTTSDLQIEKFIAMNYHTVSHAVENILRNRKAAALNLFNKAVEMTERQREFDMRWRDQPKDEPVRWETERGGHRWVWYDLDSRQHEIYIMESENSIRDACHQIATYDRILEKLEQQNGGIITREQFNQEAATNWKRKFQRDIFDDMLSRQTGITPTVLDALRKVMAPGLVDPNVHTVGEGSVPSFDKAVTAPIEYMTAMSVGITDSLNVFAFDKPLEPKIDSSVQPQLEDWFNSDVKK